MFPAMNKENAPYVLQEEFAGSPTILKPLASKDYEYFQSQTEQMEDYGASPFYDQFNEIGVDDRCNGFDLPDKGEKAFRDLYCLSQRVAEGINNGDAGLQEVKGPIFMKRKFPRKYRSKYGSVANHPNYGPVLFLFAYDEKAQNADLKNPQMIALMDCNVKLGRNVKSRDGRFKCEFIVSTAKKRHVFAAKDSIIRDYWIESIKKLA